MIRTAVISVTASFVLFGACRGGDWLIDVD
jgi:hypothetical protein